MWFQTFSGRTINFQHPPITWPIRLKDIAHALANICRWGGHTRRFYSVAQHSILVSDHLEPHGPEMMLRGLFHDAAEAYVGDMIGPLKLYLKTSRQPAPCLAYSELESQVHDAIALLFDLPKGFQHCPEVREADLRALATENRDLCFPSNEHKDWAQKTLPEPFPFSISPISSEQAEFHFKKQFCEIYSRMHPDSTPPVDR